MCSLPMFSYFILFPKALVYFFRFSWIMKELHPSVEFKASFLNAGHISGGKTIFPWFNIIFFFIVVGKSNPGALYQWSTSPTFYFIFNFEIVSINYPRETWTCDPPALTFQSAKITATHYFAWVYDILFITNKGKVREKHSQGREELIVFILFFLCILS